MVKRGIGVFVLAIIAALLLSTLLKDKSSQRQDVVDMELPGAPDINIPSLTDSTEPQAQEVGSTAILVNEAGSHMTNNAADAGNAVVASAAGIITSAKDTAAENLNAATDSVANSTSDAVSNAARGFSFRPAMKNEEKQSINTASAENLPQGISAAKEITPPKVVASTQEAPKKFKPRLEEEKKEAKKTAKKAKELAKKEAKQAKKKAETVAKNTNTPAKASPKKQVAKPAAVAVAGKYSIQLLATSSQSRANKLLKTMQGEGYQSFITRTERDNKVLFRVRVGGHNNRNLAIKAQEGMKRRYQKNFFVQNSLVVSN